MDPYPVAVDYPGYVACVLCAAIEDLMHAVSARCLKKAPFRIVQAKLKSVVIYTMGLLAEMADGTSMQVLGKALPATDFTKMFQQK